MTEMTVGIVKEEITLILILVSKVSKRCKSCNRLKVEGSKLNEKNGIVNEEIRLILIFGF